MMKQSPYYVPQICTFFIPFCHCALSNPTFVEEAAMHHMLAYRPDLGPTFFTTLTTIFIDVKVLLSRQIRAVVLIQRPDDFDTAASMALTQT